LGEREEISRGLASNISLRQIAKKPGRAPSTVSREINRHGGRKNYRAILADERAWHLSRRPRICKLEQEPRLRRIVSEKLSLQWSPEQISGWLKREYLQDGTMQISHETIYRSLFIQSRGVLKKELTKHLRTGRKMRQSKTYNTKGVEGK
jgi:IS30 family transposase